MKKFALGFVMMMVAVLAMPSIVSADNQATYWATIVSSVKNSDVIKELESEYNVSITDDSTKLVIEVAGGKLTSPYTITYTRYNDIVSFTSNNTTLDGTIAQIENEVNGQFLLSVAEHYGYNTISFMLWLSSLNDGAGLTVNNDGIEFTYYTYQYESQIEAGDGVEITNGGTITGIGSTYKTLKVNIDCGISAFDPNVTTPEPDISIPTPVPTPVPEKELENPETGLYVSLGILTVAVAGVIALLSTKKKKYFSKI